MVPKKVSALLALVLMLVAGAALAETPADQNLASVLGLDAASCDAAVVDAEPAAELDLENALQVDLTDTEPCNQRVCGHGQYCCNFSCSRCAPDGFLCTQEACL